MELVVGTVVGFSGGIGSGKTSLSQAVAEELDCPWVSFGDYVRKVAADRGYGQDRESLQVVGESLVHEGWPRFCLAVLNQAPWKPGQDLIIDGVRHAEGVRTLRSLVKPSLFRLIGISLDATGRWAREGGDAHVDELAIQSIEAHSTEAEVQPRVMPMADLVLDGARPLNELVREVVNWLAAQ